MKITLLTAQTANIAHQEKMLWKDTLKTQKYWMRVFDSKYLQLNPSQGH